MPKPGATPLDLTRVTIEPFSDKAVLNRFSCGNRTLDAFLKNKAKKAVRRLEHSVFCAHLDGSPNVIGYYALQVGADSVSELPDSNKENYLKKNYVAFPAINLSFLAVDGPYQRQHLGEFLLMDVFARVAALSEHVGFYALTLQSVDDDSTAFYNSLNFTAYSQNISPPKMLYPLEDILALIDQQPSPNPD